MTLLASLAAVSQRVSATSARLAKISELAAFLRTLEANEIAIAVHYLSGETPQGRIGIGYTVLRQATPETIVDEPTLALHDVDAALDALCGLRGAGSSSRRAQTLRELLTRSTMPERQFLLALLIGELRQGALTGVMIDAIAAAAELPAAAVRRAAMYSKDLGEVARTALLQGAEALQRFRLALFTPVAPMLAQTAIDVAEALAQLGGELAFEWKMDGARIQVHKSAAEVRIYTRTLNEVTDALPEVVHAVRALAARELVLDGEAIALDAAQRPHPFQITMPRAATSC